MLLCGRHGMIVVLVALRVTRVCCDGRCDPNSRDKDVHPSPCDYVRQNNRTGIAQSLKRCLAGVDSTGCKVRFFPDCASDGLVPYTDLHYCTLALSGDFLTTATSVALLVLLVCVYMTMLSKLADHFFCPVLDQLSDMLGLSSDVAGLTLLSFGNGAPDVFAQIAAVAKSHGAPPNWGLAVGAVFGAGMFVTHAVLAGVLLSVRHSYVTVKKGPYLRDVIVYTVVILAMMMLFVDGHVSFSESCAFSAAYFVYVAGAVLQQRCIGDAESLNTASEMELSDLTNRIHLEDAEPEPSPGRGTQDRSVTSRCIGAVTSRLDRLLQLGLALCIPQFPEGERAEKAAWDLDLVPLSSILLIGMLLELIDISGQVLLAVAAAAAVSLVGRFIWPHAMPTLRRAAPKTLVAVIFATCIVWMSAVAGELVSVLETLGIISKVPGTVLGVTVLAWGNSLGDMVSNCAVARSGHPTMAIAAIYGGPVFNTLAGMATGLAITTARAGTIAVTWHGHGNEVVLLGLCLLLGQARALIHVPCCGRWTLRRSLAWKLIAYYVAFTLAMILLVLRGGSQACWLSSFCS